MLTLWYCGIINRAKACIFFLFFVYLKRLEIQGFKSFARKSVLEFEPGITAIVGPNGSGKSNVADAIRWVLGEQSSKMLRGKKSDDVIFAGSDKKVRQSFAEVIATFDNADHRIPLDASEVSIGRRVDRSGESEYLINGSKVRLLDIIDLILKSNINTGRYTVIGQGTIDQMILAGPAEIKAVIDEASGVKTYYIRREKTLRRLEQTAQNLMRAEDLLKEIEPRLKNLRRQAKRMEARETIETELKALRQEFLGGQYWVLWKQSQSLAGAIASQKQEALQEVESKVAHLGQEVARAQAESNQARASLQEKKKQLAEVESILRTLYQKLQKPQVHAQTKQPEDYTVLEGHFSSLEQALELGDLALVREAAQKLMDAWQKLRQKSAEPRQQGQTDTELEQIRSQLLTETAKKDSLQADINTLSVAESKAKLSLDFLQQQLNQAKQGRSAAYHADQEVEKAKIDVQLEAVVADIRHYLGEPTLELIIKQPVTETAPEVQEKINKLQHQLDLIGGVDELTLKEYQETEIRFTKLTEQVTDLQRGMEDLRSIIDELDEHIKTRFNSSFQKINEKFEFYFRMLFNGGRGVLTVLRANEEQASEQESIDGADIPVQAQLRPEEKIVQKYERGPNTVIGIDIKATPPGKKLSSIQALSGGERALTSIALLCAMLACFPSPFVVLDEVDAALDEANTIRFGQILGTLAHQTQFVTITHNRETMAQSNILYGVTMGDDGISKLLSIKLDQAKAYAK